MPVDRFLHSTWPDEFTIFGGNVRLCMFFRRDLRFPSVGHPRRAEPDTHIMRWLPLLINQRSNQVHQGAMLRTMLL